MAVSSCTGSDPRHAGIPGGLRHGLGHGVGLEIHEEPRLSLRGGALEPLGRVLSGYGNNGEDGTEGAHWKNVFGTYSHGPMLPKNPQFCDMLLLTALERKYGRAELQPLDDAAERAAHDEMCARI